MTRLTDEQIIAIRDEHLPSQGEAFDTLAYARTIEAAVLAANPQREEVMQSDVYVQSSLHGNSETAMPCTRDNAVTGAAHPQNADVVRPDVADVLRDLDDAIIDSENDRARRYTTTLKNAAALIRELIDHYETGILAGENDCQKHADKVYWNCVVCRAERAEEQFKSLREATRTEWADLWERTRKAEAERGAAIKDAERLRWVATDLGIDGIGDIDLHEEAAINSSALGRDEPNGNDYLAAIRTAIDAAIARAGEK